MNMKFVSLKPNESVFKVKKDLAITPSLLEKLKISPKTPAFPSPNIPNPSDLSLLNQSFSKFPYPGVQKRELVKSSCSSHLQKKSLESFKAKLVAHKILQSEQLPGKSLKN